MSVWQLGRTPCPTRIAQGVAAAPMKRIFETIFPYAAVLFVVLAILSRMLRFRTVRSPSMLWGVSSWVFWQELRITFNIH